MATTLKTKCTSKQTPGGGGDSTTTLIFGPDYEDGRNSEWAAFTPALTVTFTVKNEIADRWEQGNAYTFTIDESVED